MRLIVAASQNGDRPFELPCARLHFAALLACGCAWAGAEEARPCQGNRCVWIRGLLKLEALSQREAGIRSKFLELKTPCRIWPTSPDRLASCVRI